MPDALRRLAQAAREAEGLVAKAPRAAGRDFAEFSALQAFSNDHEPTFSTLSFLSVRVVG
jgi:hypothetical protein